MIKPIFPVDETVDQTNYYWFEKAFNETEFDYVHNLQQLYHYTEGITIGSDQKDEVIRKSDIKWIIHDSKSEWLYDKLIKLAVEANSQWKFNLSSVIDSIQYTEYHEGGGHYDWHVDIGPGSISHRKISITVQLSSPDEYEGGDFQMWTGGEFKDLPKIKGCAILFPSFLLHRVTPITKGTRKSLVLWVGGKNFQ